MKVWRKVNDMVEKIYKIIEDVLKLTAEEIEKVTEDTDLIEVGMDSLNAIEVVVNIENEFDIQVEDEDLLLSNISTVRLLQELVNKYIS